MQCLLQHCSYGPVNDYRIANPQVNWRSRKFARNSLLASHRSMPIASPIVAHLIAIDAGTTGVRSLLLNEDGEALDLEYRELTQHYPSPGHVEHDATEIWRLTAATLEAVAARARTNGLEVAAIGITNQRETVLAWNATTGEVYGRALVWQDKRTAALCRSLRDAGHLDSVRAATGLVLDPYFSATKMAWLLDHHELRTSKDVRLGTIDSWLLWNLSGGVDGGVFATDPSNASRTLLFDLASQSWSDAMAELFDVPIESLAPVQPSCGRFGIVTASDTPSAHELPISGILGDQHAALFGQACFTPGMIKATYGTGAFVLAQVGAAPPSPSHGLLATVAWDLGDHGGVSYALEGSAFVAGAAIQWLRDELAIIGSASEIEALARKVDNAEGLSFIPAFVGLGSPWWDDSARGALVGITRGSGRAALARAVIDSIAFEVRAITDSMAESTGTPLLGIRVDGGAAAMDLLLSTQADQSRLTVTRPTSLESTAIGAAAIAGLAEGVFTSLDDLASHYVPEASFTPTSDEQACDDAYAIWLRALERSRSWVR